MLSTQQWRSRRTQESADLMPHRNAPPTTPMRSLLAAFIEWCNDPDTGANPFCHSGYPSSVMLGAATAHLREGRRLLAEFFHAPSKAWSATRVIHESEDTIDAMIKERDGPAYYLWLEARGGVHSVRIEDYDVWFAQVLLQALRSYETDYSETTSLPALSGSTFSVVVGGFEWKTRLQPGRAIQVVRSRLARAAGLPALTLDQPVEGIRKSGKYVVCKETMLVSGAYKSPQPIWLTHRLLVEEGDFARWEITYDIPEWESPLDLWVQQFVDEVIHKRRIEAIGVLFVPEASCVFTRLLKRAADKAGERGETIERWSVSGSKNRAGLAAIRDALLHLFDELGDQAPVIEPTSRTSFELYGSEEHPTDHPKREIILSVERRKLIKLEVTITYVAGGSTKGAPRPKPLPDVLEVQPLPEISVPAADGASLGAEEHGNDRLSTAAGFAGAEEEGETMACPGCNARIEDNWAFCPDCGQALT
jgi:hypothetical protein